MTGHIHFTRNDGVAEIAISRQLSTQEAARIEQMLRSAFSQQAPSQLDESLSGQLGGSQDGQPQGFAYRLPAAVHHALKLTADEAVIDPAEAIAAAVRRAGGGA